MPTKYVCMDGFDNYVTTSESAARDHIEANSGHHILEIDEDDTNHTVTTTRMEVEEQE